MGTQLWTADVKLLSAGPFSAEAEAKACQTMFGVEPRPDWPIINFGGYNVADASNIVFSNGLLDPWSTGAPPLR